MSLMSKIQSGVVHKPPRLIIYGTHGIGKTTLACGAPVPILVQTEDGAEAIGVDRFPQCTSYEDIMDQLTALIEEDHQFQTLILDSLDWAEKLVWDYSCRQNGWVSITDPDFGRGYAKATENWQFIADLLQRLRDERGMSIILLAHSQIKRFEDPTSGGYERYQIDLHRGASSLMQEMADAVFFMNWKTVITEEKGGFAKVNKAKGNGQRLIFTEERPAALSKNRFGMPDRIEIPNDPAESWSALSAHIPYFAN